MKKAKQCLTALLPGVLLAITVLSGCGQSQKAVSKNDDHLTVYLWENRLMKNIVPYIHEQFPATAPKSHDTLPLAFTQANPSSSFRTCAR